MVDTTDRPADPLAPPTKAELASFVVKIETAVRTLEALGELSSHQSALIERLGRDVVERDHVIAELRRTLEAARAALGRYGRHADTCAWWDATLCALDIRERPCDCGFAAARASEGQG